MAAPKRPPRSWDIDDFMDLGRRSGATHLKAVPVLILENWVQGERQVDKADHVRTKVSVRRLVGSKLADFKRKGTGSVFGCLIKMQSGRNLTDPPLIRYRGAGTYWINLPHYEPLLQEYRKVYREHYPEGYTKLYPEGEPEWEPLTPAEARPEREEAEPVPIEPEVEDEIQNLLVSLERALRDRQQAIERLTGEAQKLQTELAALQADLQEERKISVLGEITDNELNQRLSRLGSAPLDTKVWEAGVVLEERLRVRSRTDGELYGTDLVDAVLAPKRGTLIFSQRAGEQEGVRMLYRGAMQFIRNPVMHRLIKYDESTARLFVRIIDALLQLLSEIEKLQAE